MTIMESKCRYLRRLTERADRDITGTSDHTNSSSIVGGPSLIPQNWHSKTVTAKKNNR